MRKTLLQPPDDARIMMRWWWFGPSVTRMELERELRAMKAAGIGGVEIQTVYPLSLDDPGKGIRNYPFLSPEYLTMLRFAADKARELGLRVDVTLGSGWPYGGPHIPLEQAAGMLRVEQIQRPVKLREGETVIAEFPDLGLRFIAGHTRMMVKRAAVGAEGFVLDHCNRAALETHLKRVGEPLLQSFGPQPPYALFADSLEVYGSDWTAGFLAEFQKRRGYDLKPMLPSLVGEADDNKGAVRNDWAQTLTELVEERFLRPLTEWAHSHGTLARVQTYGYPPVTLSSQRFADLAEGESSHWKSLTPTRWASSANHILGRAVTASETWTWLHSPAFAATPLDMKAEADRHFLQGINQLVGHGWPYSPPGAGSPGWAFYAAGVFNDSNPWWSVMPEVSRYLQRMSWLLRQGKAVNDVALYVPVSDTRSLFTAGTGRVSVDRQAGEVIGSRVIPQILGAGFTFDLVDDGLLEEALAAGGYRIVVLPNVARIPVESYRRLEQFSKSGGVVVAARRLPALAPGLMRAEEDGREIREISQRLFQGGRGTFIEDDSRLGTALKQRTKPDVIFDPANADLGFVHRTLGNMDVYFLANTGNRPYRGTVEFGVAGRRAERWDPTTAAFTGAGPELELAPYESTVLVFSDSATSDPPLAAAHGTVMDLSKNWSVRFVGTGRRMQMSELRSWTEEAATRFYSGIAVYEKEFMVDKGMEAATLDFGEGVPLTPQERSPGMRAWLAAPVRDAAVVYVNGRRAGSVWAPPYRLDLTGVLRAGKNKLRVEVANTALNKLAGQGEPDYRAVHAKYGARFEMQDMKNMKPEPAGLLGPVKLVAH